MKKAAIYIFIVYISLLLLAMGGKAILHAMLPQYDYPLYWAVAALFFVLYGVAYIVLSPQAVTTKKFYERFLVFKTLKLIMSLAAMLILVFIFREQAHNLLITFLIYYLVMMIPETLYSVYVKKHVIVK